MTAELPEMPWEPKMRSSILGIEETWEEPDGTMIKERTEYSVTDIGNGYVLVGGGKVITIRKALLEGLWKFHRQVDVLVEEDR